MNASEDEEPDYHTTRSAQRHRETTKPGEAYSLGGAVPAGETQPVVVPWLEGRGIEIHDETANVVLTGVQAMCLSQWLQEHYPTLEMVKEALRESPEPCIKTWNGRRCVRTAPRHEDHETAWGNTWTDAEQLGALNPKGVIEFKPKPKVYCVTYDSIEEIVEAVDFCSAIKIWHAALIAEFKRDGNFEEEDLGREPESVVLISETPVLRQKI